MWEQERPLCGNTTWTGTKTSLGPTRRRPGLFQRPTSRHHESINMLLDCGQTLTLPTCRHLFLTSLFCTRETKHNLQTQETFYVIHCASPKSRTISRNVVFLVVFHPPLRLVGSWWPPIWRPSCMWIATNSRDWASTWMILPSNSMWIPPRTGMNSGGDKWDGCVNCICPGEFMLHCWCEIWRISLSKSTFLYIQVVWSYHFDCWNTLYIRCFSFTMTTACLLGAQKVATGFVSESTLLTNAVMKTSNGRNLNHFQNYIVLCSIISIIMSTRLLFS